MALWNNTDEAQSAPKHTVNIVNGETGVEAFNKTPVGTFGIDAAEAGENAKVTHAGWTLRTEGEGGRSGRVFHETLVAMGSMTGDADSIEPNTTTITITEQPFDQTITQGETANFAVDYEVSNENVTPTIQWQVSTDSGDTWDDIDGETGFDLQVASTDDEYADGNQFRAVVTGGGSEVISDVATLTVTPL
jgi:hypothetical protein